MIKGMQRHLRSCGLSSLLRNISDTFSSWHPRGPGTLDGSFPSALVSKISRGGVEVASEFGSVCGFNARPLGLDYHELPSVCRRHVSCKLEVTLSCRIFETLFPAYRTLCLPLTYFIHLCRKRSY